MLMNAITPTPNYPDSAVSSRPRTAWRLVVRTLGKAWRGNIFSEAAEGAFWQTLSLPPLLLGLLGSLGYLGQWFGPAVVIAERDRLISFSRTVFSPNVVETIIEPTITDILTKAQTQIASFGFLLSLWAGSSAIASFVDAITVAYGQHGERNDVWQRIVSLLMYLVGLVIAIVGLPVLALGPKLLPKVFPGPWQHIVAQLTGMFYYPVIAVLLIIALATLYKVSPPHRLPWRRGLPGAVLAMTVFLLASVILRIYLGWIGRTGYTYGALAAPIAFLLFTFFIGLAIIVGAHFNSAIEEFWPAKPTRQQRGKWRRLHDGRDQLTSIDHLD
jgi:membrane protein